MRKVSSGEAEFFRDPALAARLRFRFAGPMFPPSIVYKVYCNSKVSYLSGCTHIRGTTTAAEDACDVMGEHKCGRLQFSTLLRGVYTLCPDRYRDIVMTDVLRDAPIPLDWIPKDDRRERLRALSAWDNLPVHLGMCRGDVVVLGASNIFLSFRRSW